MPEVLLTETPPADQLWEAYLKLMGKPNDHWLPANLEDYDD